MRHRLLTLLNRAESIPFRKQIPISLPAAGSSVSGAILGLRLTDPAMTAVLNQQGQGNSLKFTQTDGTKIPHQVIRIDWPVTTDGAFAGFPQYASVYSTGYTYWGYINQFGECSVDYYKHADGSVGTFILETITTGLGSGVDDHCVPTLLVLASGKVLAAYAAHNGTILKTRRQTTAGTPGTWDAAVSIDGTNQTAEPELAQLSSTAGSDGGDLYCFYRNTSDSYKRYYAKSTDGGGTWGTGVVLFQSPDNANRGTNDSIRRPYTRVVSNHAGTKLHMSVTDGLPGEVINPANSFKVNSVYHCYFDPSDGNLHNMDGTTVAGGSLASPPSGGFDTATLSKVLDGFAVQLPYWIWSIECNPATDFPMMAGYKHTSPQPDPSPTADPLIVRWTGTAWAVSDLISLGLGSSTCVAQAALEPYYHAGLMLSPVDPSKTAYLANPDATTGLWSVWRIVSPDGGATWAIDQRLSTTRGGERKCIRPAPVRGYPGKGPEVFWMEGHYYYWMTNFTAEGIPGVTSFNHDLYSTGIQCYPRINDGYAAWLKLDRDTNPLSIYAIYDSPGTADQSQPGSVWAGWYDYARDIHVNKWDTKRSLAWQNGTAFTAIFIGSWTRSSFVSTEQMTYLSNWLDVSHAGYLMRESSASASDIRSQFIDSVGGVPGTTTSWSASPSVQDWEVLGVSWDKNANSGKLLPYRNSSALTQITGSTNPINATVSPITLTYGHSKHQNTSNWWHGKIGFSAVANIAQPAAWHTEFYNSNPFNPAWNYASLGSLQNLE